MSFSDDEYFSTSSEESSSDESTCRGITCTSKLVLECGSKRMRLQMHLGHQSDETFDEDEWFWRNSYALPGVQLRSCWVHEMLRRRPTDGEFVRICLPYRKHPSKFFNYFRMTVDTFDYILSHVEGKLRKRSIRPSISPHERLAVTLRYLATGMTFHALGDSFLMGTFTISKIVPEVCKVIFESLVKKHMPVPSREDFLKVAEDFEEQWDFPHCIGALDGKHVRIKCPPTPNSGTMFFNYKRFYSIVLQAVADSHCRFLFVDVGAYGKQSDRGVFQGSELNGFLKNMSNFPEDSEVEGMDIKVPYLFVVNDAYPLRWNMMKPYSRPHLTKEEHIFNGRLSRARRCVECSFGILGNKWRVLLKEIETNLESASEIVKCLTVLHNVVIDKEGIDPYLLGKVNEKVDQLSMHGKLKTGRKYNRSAADAIKLRDALTDYFQTDEGFVPWQDRYLK